jgi:hypothetical protein
MLFSIRFQRVWIQVPPNSLRLWPSLLPLSLPPFPWNRRQITFVTAKQCPLPITSYWIFQPTKITYVTDICRPLLDKNPEPEFLIQWSLFS